MGGLAIKQVVGREADRIPKNIRNQMVRYFNNLNEKSFTVPEILEKEDFGDLDVYLIGGQDYNAYTRDHDDIDLKYLGHHRNGTTTSIAFGREGKIYQVDVCNGANYFSFFYYGNNDFGNLLGRIAHRCGYKLGHDGFYAIEKTDENRTVFKFNVFKRYGAENLLGSEFDRRMYTLVKFKTILYKFLGYDKHLVEAHTEHFLNGFPTFSDMFDFIKQSRFFDSDIFALENLNQINRIRNKKRTSYMNFLEHIQTNKIVGEVVDKRLNFLKLVDEFGLQISYFQRAVIAQEKKFARAKFSGREILSIPERYGLELALPEKNVYVSTFIVWVLITYTTFIKGENKQHAYAHLVTTTPTKNLWNYAEAFYLQWINNRQSLPSVKDWEEKEEIDEDEN